MDHDEAPMIRRRPPEAEPTPAPSEGELSRIAREAVHQPADPRLDRQLARMGLMESPEPAELQPGQPAGHSAVSPSELGRLDRRLRRFEVILVVLVAAVGILALIDVILLLR
jgi:hypothetical protein